MHICAAGRPQLLTLANGQPPEGKWSSCLRLRTSLRANLGNCLRNCLFRNLHHFLGRSRRRLPDQFGLRLAQCIAQQWVQTMQIRGIQPLLNGQTQHGGTRNRELCSEFINSCVEIERKSYGYRIHVGETFRRFYLPNQGKLAYCNSIRKIPTNRKKMNHFEPSASQPLQPSLFQDKSEQINDLSHSSADPFLEAISAGLTKLEKIIHRGDANELRSLLARVPPSHFQTNPHA